MEWELDKTGLDSPLFEGFCDTSDRNFFFVTNMETNVTRWDKKMVSYFGMHSEYMIDGGFVWSEFVHPDDREEYLKDITELMSGRNRVHTMDYRARNSKGEYVRCTSRGIVIDGKDGGADMFVGSIENHSISDNVDSVTNLYNIIGFRQYYQLLRQNGQGGTIILVGINNFSEVNDLYGYRIGDQLLRIFGESLVSKIGHKCGPVYRMDGVRFACCLVGMDDKDEVSTIYDQIKRIAAHELYLGGERIAITVSAGAVVLGEGYDESSLLTSASYSLQQSKYEKHGELVFFDENLMADSRKNVEILSTLRESIRNDCDGFFLCYQPVIGAESEKLVGAEALLRWEKEPYGLVPPGLFIAWLENDPNFFDLGNWILRRAMTEGKEILNYYPDFILNVNIAYPQLSRKRFRKCLKEIIDETGYPPKNLCLELTERCHQLEISYLQKEIDYLKSLGIKIAIDDFGTGFSSLNLLKDLDVDTLKIDRSFVSDIQGNVANQEIVRAISNCATNLNIHVCMEGLEDRDMIDYMSRFGPYSYQGYYYSRPIRMEDFKVKYFPQENN